MAIAVHWYQRRGDRAVTGKYGSLNHNNYMQSTPNVSVFAQVEQIAKVCHETNRAYCQTIGDYSQKPWEEAENWQRESAVKAVNFRLNNPDAPASAQHDEWTADKEADGWVFGETKDAEKKTHPCLVPYDELPIEQRRKDYLFQAVVDALTRE